MEKLKEFQVTAREGGFVELEECDGGTVLWLRKETPDAGTQTHQRICIDSEANIATVYWMNSGEKIESKTFRSAPLLQAWFSAQGSVMTNREAIQRLSVSASDDVAMKWLRETNATVIRAAVTRYFGAGDAADKAEDVVVQRMAAHAGTYELKEDADEWLARRANMECDRLRNEAIHDKANGD